MKSKTQQLRENRYKQQLKKCGFRSWKAAKNRRFELCYIDPRTEEQEKELKQLQILCDLYVAWKTNDMIGRATKKVDRMAKKLGIIPLGAIDN